MWPVSHTPFASADSLVTRARLGVISHKAKIAAFQCVANLGRLSEAISSLQELQILHDNMFGRQHKYYGQTLVALARAQHLSGNARAARCLYDKVSFQLFKRSPHLDSRGSLVSGRASVVAAHGPSTSPCHRCQCCLCVCSD